MSYRWLAAARVLHLLAVVIWIGGIAAVTTVMLPAIREIDSKEQKIWLFERVERRFRPQAQLAWLVVGLTGAYMLTGLNAWPRLLELRYCWIHAMVALWVFFGLMLFIIEPLVVGPRVRLELARQPARTIARMEIAHWVVLVLSLLVIAVVLAGINGLL